MATCIFCGSADNLNTSLSIALDDGTRVDVAICDEHAEEATVKTVKAAYLDRQKQIDAVLAQAKALGLNLSLTTGDQVTGTPTASGLVVAQQVQQPVATKPVATQSRVAPLLEDDGDGMVVPKERMNRMMTSVGGQVGSGDIRANVPSYASHNLTEEFTDKHGNRLAPGTLNGQMKVVEVEGRDGMPLALPRVIRDGTGTTSVRVVKTDDQTLQRRFKDMAKASLSDAGPDYRNSYDQLEERRCPVCRGECEVVNRGRRITCPKCGGAGVI